MRHRIDSYEPVLRIICLNAILLNYWMAHAKLSTSFPGMVVTSLTFAYIFGKSLTQSWIPVLIHTLLQSLWLNLPNFCILCAVLQRAWCLSIKQSQRCLFTEILNFQWDCSAATLLQQLLSINLPLSKGFILIHHCAIAIHLLYRYLILSSIIIIDSDAWTLLAVEWISRYFISHLRIEKWIVFLRILKTVWRIPSEFAGNNLSQLFRFRLYLHGLANHVIMLFLGNTLMIVHPAGSIAILIVLRSPNHLHFYSTPGLLLSTVLGSQRCFLLPQKLLTSVILYHGVIPLWRFVSVHIFVIDKILIVFDD